jgi:hypothetical protein
MYPAYPADTKWPVETKLYHLYKGVSTRADYRKKLYTFFHLLGLNPKLPSFPGTDDEWSQIHEWERYPYALVLLQRCEKIVNEGLPPELTSIPVGLRNAVDEPVLTVACVPKVTMVDHTPIMLYSNPVSQVCKDMRTISPECTESIVLKMKQDPNNHWGPDGRDPDGIWTSPHPLWIWGDTSTKCRLDIRTSAHCISNAYIHRLFNTIDSEDLSLPHVCLKPNVEFIIHEQHTLPLRLFISDPKRYFDFFGFAIHENDDIVCIECEGRLPESSNM